MVLKAKEHGTSLKVLSQTCISPKGATDILSITDFEVRHQYLEYDGACLSARFLARLKSELSAKSGRFALQSATYPKEENKQIGATLQDIKGPVLPLLLFLPSPHFFSLCFTSSKLRASMCTKIFGRVQLAT